MSDNKPKIDLKARLGKKTGTPATASVPPPMAPQTASNLPRPQAVPGPRPSGMPAPRTSPSGVPIPPFQQAPSQAPRADPTNPYGSMPRQSVPIQARPTEIRVDMDEVRAAQRSGRGKVMVLALVTAVVGGVVGFAFGGGAERDKGAKAAIEGAQDLVKEIEASNKQIQDLSETVKSAQTKLLGKGTYPQEEVTKLGAINIPFRTASLADKSIGRFKREILSMLIDYTTSATTLDPYRFQSQAGAVITIDASNNVKIYSSAGTDITNATTGTNKSMSDAFKSAITTNQTITDNREGATTGNGSIRLATLDVSVITTAINTGKFGNFNGIIYITDISAGANGLTNKRGIRLKNGAKLPDGSSVGSALGLTVASANPIYVQGDYNTGTTASVQPASNSGDPTQPTVPGYTRQPAAIIADAVNILSNSWSDALAGTVPNATNTTINAGIISGIVPSGSGYYSGGVENFPRFLENWSGNTLTYYGSMLELYNSQQAIGHWGAANVYSPPNRAWYFDTNFLSKPPPGVMASYDYIRSRWYMQ